MEIIDKIGLDKLVGSGNPFLFDGYGVGDLISVASSLLKNKNHLMDIPNAIISHFGKGVWEIINGRRKKGKGGPGGGPGKPGTSIEIPRKPTSRRLAMAAAVSGGFEDLPDSVVAHNLMAVNPSHFALEQAPTDVDLGIGTRIVFRQPLCWIGQGTYTADVGWDPGAFFLIPLSDVSISQNLFQVHPKSFGGRVKTFGSLFDRYRMKYLRMIMVPTAPTSKEGQVALAYVPDVFFPDVQGLPLSFYDIMTTLPSTACPFRESFDFTVTQFGRDAKYCDSTTTTRADGRLDISGIVASDFVGPQSQEGETGLQICYVEGVIDFYCPVAIHDFSLMKVPRYAAQAVEDLLKQKKDEHEEKTSVTPNPSVKTSLPFRPTGGGGKSK